MENPFKNIDIRLDTIESLLYDIKELQRSNSYPDIEREEILNVSQAAEVLNLATPSIYTLVSKRKIPHYKKGKKLYFKRTELIKWLESGKKRTGTELRLHWEGDQFVDELKKEVKKMPLMVGKDDVLALIDRLKETLI